MQFEPAQRWGDSERTITHTPSAPDLFRLDSSGCEPWAASSVSSIAELARAQALGKPQSSKKAARPEDVFPVLASSAFSSVASSASSASHDRWAPLPAPPRPARFARFSRFFGAGAADQQLARFLGVVTDVEKEPLIKAASSSWDALRARVGAAPPPPPPGRCHCLCRRLPALTYRQRLVGFCLCLGLGFMLSLTSLLSFGALLAGNPTPFAFKYTLGSLLSMGASSFLVGPVKQCEGMFAPVRRLASLLYVASLCATLVCIFRLHDRLLTSISMCLQLAAMVWYCLTYVPFGHMLLRRCVGTVLKT